MNTYARVFGAVIVFGVLVLAGLVLVGAFAKQAVHDGVVTRLKYKLPDGYKTDPNYEVCYRSHKAAFYEEYYLWNLTNLQETLDGGKPIFNLTGPFSYTQWYCEYQHTANEDEGYLSYKTYYDGYIFLPDDSVSNDDCFITNLNPAYIALLQQIGDDGNLKYVMTGGALEALIKEFQSPEVLSLLWMNAIPQVLAPMNSGIISMVLSKTVAGTLQHLGEANLFNASYDSNGGVQGFAEYTLSLNSSADVSLATETENAIFTYWTNYTLLLAFAQMTPSTIEETFSVTASQATYLRLYVSYLFTMFTVPATQNVYNQWANAPSASYYPGWEVGSATGISFADVTALFNVTGPCALASVTGITAWLAVIQGKATLDQVCPGVFTLTQQQQLAVLGWISSYSTSVVNPQLLAKFELEDWNDFAYAQWGHLVAGQSLQAAAGLSFPPEINAFPNATNIELCATYSTEDAKALLNGTVPLFNLTNMVEFFALMNQGEYSQVYGLWKQLDFLKAVCLAQYLQIIIQDQIINPKIEAAKEQGGTLFTTRTVRQWLFTAQDPLLVTLGQNPNVPLIGNLTRSKADADLLNSTYLRIYTGHNDLHWSLMPVRENELIPYWKHPVYITGYNGSQFLPNGYLDNLNDAKYKDEPLVLFHPMINRTIPFQNKGKDTWQGVNVRYLALSDDALASAALNPANDAYYAEYSGVINKTSNPPYLPLFVSTPNFLSAEKAFYENVSFTDNIFTDYDPTDRLSRHRLSLFILAEPTLGTSVWGNLPIQINFKYGPTTFYPKVNPAYAPIYWNAIGAIASSHDLSTIKNQLYAGQRAWKAFIGVGVGVGVLLIVAGIVGVHHFKKHENELKEIKYDNK